MWVGGDGGDSAEVWRVAAFACSSLPSPFGPAGGTGTGSGAGAVVGGFGSGLGGDGSSEWRLVTGVILFGGVGGERLPCAGTMMTPLTGCVSSAVKKKKPRRNQYMLHRTMLRIKTTFSL